MVDSQPFYDRALLLNGPKRNDVLELWEVERYGRDCYGDRDYVSLYGMRPRDWHARRVRVLGRTAVECTRDALGDAIGRDVASIATASASPRALILDLFAGSGNTLYWLLRHLPGARAVGFESDAGVFRLTRQNLTAFALPIDVVNADYRMGLVDVEAGADELAIAFVAPPWGAALDSVAGLDLRRTLPPVVEIVEVLVRRFSGQRLLCAIQVYEKVDGDSLAELNARFDWSASRVYGLNAPGQNHGIVLGTKGWTPSGDSSGPKRG